jgi:hypothetical protein
MLKVKKYRVYCGKAEQILAGRVVPWNTTQWLSPEQSSPRRRAMRGSGDGGIPGRVKILLGRLQPNPSLELDMYEVEILLYSIPAWK